MTKDVKTLKVDSLNTDNKCFVRVSIGGNYYAFSKPKLMKAIEVIYQWQHMNCKDSFNVQLVNLIAKADYQNKLKFFKSFPAITVAYLLWYNRVDFTKDADFFKKMSDILGD